MRILLVEDEPRVARVVAKGLREQFNAVDISTDGADALYRVTIEEYDLVILDVMLPVKDGYTVCKELRASGFTNLVLMLTARHSVEDRVNGLDSGADDYLSKPFDFKELLARIRALRRRPRQLQAQVLQVGDLVLDMTDHSISRGGRTRLLTAKEYALLEFLILKKDRIVSREEIAQHVWDENFDPFSNVIDVYVKRLRSKIDEGFGRPLIHTRRGAGYILTNRLEQSGV